MRIGKLVGLVALSASVAGGSWAQDAAPAAEEQDVEIVPDFSAAQRPDDYAIIIGIEKYRDLPKSVFSASDARLVRDYLVALGYPPRNIELLVDERAGRADIVKTIERVLPNKVKPESKVFVYYSGHGAPDTQSGEPYLVPHDGDSTYLEDTAYPIKTLYKKLGQLKVAEVIVALDACFSGEGDRSVIAAGQRPLVTVAMPMDKGGLPPHLAIITATQGSQVSSSSPEKKHGIFTYHFLKAIKDGVKGLGEIYEKIKPEVEDEAKGLNARQSPSLQPAAAAVKGRFQFASFTRLEKPKPVVDKAAEERLKAQMKKFEEEQTRLADEQRKLKEKEAEMEKRLKDREAHLENEGRQKAADEQRRIAQERERFEQQNRLERQRLEERSREIERRKRTVQDEEPVFVPPTF